MSDVTLLVMSGIHPGGSDVEAMISDARRAITQDAIERAQQISGISHIVLSTNEHGLAEWARARGVTVELDPEGIQFHFGRRLQELVARHHLNRVLYMGGGSGPLLSVEELSRLAGPAGTLL